jgi:hypothetical protein
MINKDFNNIVCTQLEICKELLLTKGEEYSLDEDRLIAFKRAAELQGESPKQALCGMMAKHVISIYDMCMSGESFTKERWTEKITDTMNYLMLLKAIVWEEDYET